jgi:hypothetical protein
VGVLVGLDQAGVPLVEYPCSPRGGLPARSTVVLSRGQVGREVALMFEGGEPDRPLVVGVLQDPLHSPPHAQPIEVRVDAETITLTAEQEIVLQCGKASLTLTRDGKVQIRGTYLLSRSSGVNRLQGGSIELN